MLFLQNDYTWFKAEMLRQVNQVRTSGCKCGNQYMAPAAPLQWSEKLAFSAADHAYDMYRNRYFNHVDSRGNSAGDRAKKRGFQWTWIAENIAMGQESITEVVRAWYTSPSHCRNLMNPNLKVIGAAKKGRYWVQDLGTPAKINKPVIELFARS